MTHQFGKETTIPEIAYRIRWERLQARLQLRRARKEGLGIKAATCVILADAHTRTADDFHWLMCKRLGVTNEKVGA